VLREAKVDELQALCAGLNHAVLWLDVPETHSTGAAGVQQERHWVLPLLPKGQQQHAAAADAQSVQHWELGIRCTRMMLLCLPIDMCWNNTRC